MTNATVWAIVAALTGWYWTAAGLIVLRLLCGLIAGVGVLRDPLTARLWWLMPRSRSVWRCGVGGGAVRK